MAERHAWRGIAALLLLVAPRSASLVSEPLRLSARQSAWTSGERLPFAEREPGQQLALRDGTWLGSADIADSWNDFRDQRIAGGRYTLCYALQPRRKEHAGVDIVRDFALLVPRQERGAEDCAGDLLASSRRASGTRHPAVLALLGAEAAAAAPREHPQWTVATLLVGGETIGFVVSGRLDPSEAF